MALRKTSGAVPEDAIELDEKGAIKHQWKMIMNWTPEKDVWPFRYGIGILSVCSALSGIYINNHYRSMLHLRDFGRFSTYLPIAVIPTLCSAVLHQEAVSNDILLEKTGCPVCVEMRSAGIQVFISTVFPSLLAPLSGFMFATRHFTYHLPPLSKPLEHFKLWQKLTRPIGNVLFIMCICHAFLGIGFAYLEENSFMKVKAELLKAEPAF